MRLFVGGFAPETTETQLHDVFSEYGTVTKVFMVKDQATGKSKCYGFVDLRDQQGALAAVKELNGSKALQRPSAKSKHKLTVEIAKPRNVPRAHAAD